MSEQTLSADCQFCSVVSQANGEDPIGSAGTHDYWIITELAQPWSEEIWQQNPTIRTILSMLKDAIANRGMKLRPVAIAADRDYSQPGYTRVLFYSRPAQQFARYDKTEYLIPDDQLVALIRALLDQSEELARFTSYQQDSHHIRELLVCTHGNVDVACSRFGYPIYQKLRQEYAGKTLRAWRCSHFGGHRFAPTLIDLPHGHYWGHVEPEILDALIDRRGSVADLRRFYRGWAGL
ncbi:MAG TPA: sucrase ferredoxin, partial [Elainellaceae cyanobacterium]